MRNISYVQVFMKAVLSVVSILFSLSLFFSAILYFFGTPPSITERLNTDSTSVTQATQSGQAVNAPAGSNLSLNWAGYVSAEPNSSYTGISASWIVPTVSVPQDVSSPFVASDATWIGIGGVNANDLIQVGTDATVENGGVTYEAWFETLPDVLQPVPLTVHPGDKMSVSLSQKSTNVWTALFINHTTDQIYSIDIPYQSSASSAEWIEEDPSSLRGTLLPLDQFGSISFRDASVTINGISTSIADSNASALSMVHDHIVMAAPTALGSDGASFTVLRGNGQNISNSRVSGTSVANDTSSSSPVPSGDQSSEPVSVGPHGFRHFYIFQSGNGVTPYIEVHSENGVPTSLIITFP